MYDSETGYYYLQSRYYDPVTSRFINADVPEMAAMELLTGEILSTNLFSYCFNNPVNHSDPTGYAAGGVTKVQFNWWGFDLYLSDSTKNALMVGQAAGAALAGKLVKGYGLLIWTTAWAARTLINWVGRNRNGVILRYLYLPLFQLYWVKSQ